MTDVFTVVFPTDVDNSPSLSSTRTPVDLYKDYLSVTRQEVAESCLWYSTWPTAENYRQNLSKTFTFSRQNCSMSLFHKVLETYDTFPVGCRGGPLFFKLMLDVLVADNAVVADSLITHLKGLKISAVQGENVNSVVSLVRHACRRLRDISRLPQDIELILLALYQTSSVPDFNSMFAIASSARQYDALGTDQRSLQHAVYQPKHQESLFQLTEDINNRADNAYAKLRGTWKVPKQRNDGGASLVAGKSTKSASGSEESTTDFRVFSFTVLLSGVCWNCGDPSHGLRNCPHPRNERKVSANREQFKRAKAKQKKTGGSTDTDSSGKPTVFAPPRPDENGRRTINGVPHTWDSNRKWWKKDGPSGNAAHTPVSAPAPATSPAAAARPADVEASLAALTRQFGATVTALSAVASQLKQG